MTIHTQNTQDIHTTNKMFDDYFHLFMSRDDLCVEARQVCELFGVENNEDLHDLLLANPTKFTLFFGFFVDKAMECGLYRLLVNLESCVLTLFPPHTRVVPLTQDNPSDEDVLTTFNECWDLFMVHPHLSATTQQVCELFGVDDTTELHDALLADMTKFAQFFNCFVAMLMPDKLYGLLYTLESCIVTLNPNHTRIIPATQRVEVTSLFGLN